jgi:hypothetical protein
MKFVLYTSILNHDDYDVLVVPDVIRTARAANEMHGITGILLFDGLNFTQYFEGNRAAVDRLLQNILHDPRHKNIVVVSTGDLETRLYKDWKMGYIDLSGYGHDHESPAMHSDLDIEVFKNMVERYEVE